MRKPITIALIIILSLNIIGCSSVQIKNENEKIKDKRIEARCKENLVNDIGGVCLIGGMILGGYVGNNLYAGKDMIKVFNITFGAFAGGLIFVGVWYLSIMALENTGLLDTKISSKLFSDESEKK